MSLNHLAREIHRINVEKGFWPDTLKPAEVLMLIVSELAEALEELRNGAHLNETRYTEDEKPEGFPSELADVIIRTLDACDAYNIDIDTVVADKIRYNRKRPYKHGRQF